MRFTTLALSLLALGLASVAVAQVGEEEEPILMNTGAERGTGLKKNKASPIRTKGARPVVEEADDEARVAPAAPVTLKGLSMVCRPGDACTIPCPNGRCAVDCAPGSTCTATCAGGECVQRCGQGANCTFSCAGGHCAQACFSATCKATCEGGDCLVKTKKTGAPAKKKVP